MDLRVALGTATPPVQNNFWPNFKERSSASLVDTPGNDTRHYRVTAGDHDEAYICCPCLSSLPSFRDHSKAPSQHSSFCVIFCHKF